MTNGTLGSRLREAREEAGHKSRSRFARQDIDIDPAVLWMYENDRREPRLEVLSRIARACGVNLEWLVTGEGPRDREPVPDSNEQAEPPAAA